MVMTGTTTKAEHNGVAGAASWGSLVCEFGDVRDTRRVATRLLRAGIRGATFATFRSRTRPIALKNFSVIQLMSNSYHGEAVAGRHRGARGGCCASPRRT